MQIVNRQPFCFPTRWMLMSQATDCWRPHQGYGCLQALRELWCFLAQHSQRRLQQTLPGVQRVWAHLTLLYQTVQVFFFIPVRRPSCAALFVYTRVAQYFYTQNILFETRGVCMTFQDVLNDVRGGPLFFRWFRFAEMATIGAISSESPKAIKNKNSNQEWLFLTTFA